MFEMDPLFREMIRTLQAAKTSVEYELEILSQTEQVDQNSLERIAQSSAAFYVQAVGLVAMMGERDAEPEMIEQANDLVDYFEDTADRLERLAQLGRG
jgi:hypothetical protein